eukprot:m.22379 g.22379  ORF g.22379 m.22379 type:complete len:109 (-) comp5450_c0_seq1:45-371(-)
MCIHSSLPLKYLDIVTIMLSLQTCRFCNRPLLTLWYQVIYSLHNDQGFFTVAQAFCFVFFVHAIGRDSLCVMSFLSFCCCLVTVYIILRIDHGASIILVGSTISKDFK